METQKNLNSQYNLKKEGQTWTYHAAWFQNILET